MSGVLVPDKEPIYSVIEGLAVYIEKGPRPDVVAIEHPYVGINAQTALVLARACGRFEQAFQRRGFDVEVYRAAAWQRAILTGLVPARGATRDALKAASVMWARATFGAQLDDDRADAAALATWALRQRSFAGRVLGT